MNHPVPMVRDMSLWQYHAALEGYIAANTPKKPKAPTDEEFDQALARWG